jgi:hypothetical protein
MKLILFPLLLLTGCTSSVEIYQSALDSYAETAFRGELEASLTGAALFQASQSRAVVAEMGWTQVGKSQFEETRLVEETTVLSCLDVSGVSFVDAAGVAVLLERNAERILMEVEFSKSNPPLVANMKEVGQC